MINLFVDVAVTYPVKQKYVADACSYYAHAVKQNVESRVYEDDALYLPLFESFGGFSRGLPFFFSKLVVLV